MTAVLAEYAVVTRKFRNMFRYGGTSIEEKKILYVREKSADGTFVVGEVPDLSTHGSGTNIEQSLGLLQAQPWDMLLAEKENLSGPLAFCLDSIALQKSITSSSVPTRTALSNALVPWLGSQESLENAVAQFLKGYRTFKWKISSDTLEDQLLTIKKFLDSLPDQGQVKIRLDANGSLSSSKQRELFSLLEAQQLLSVVDYLEEPGVDAWQIAARPVPFAADESIKNKTDLLRLLEQSNSPDVFILKPTQFGSLRAAKEQINLIKNHGKRFTITTSLETEPGRRAMILFSMRENLSSVMGFSTGHLYKENFFEDSPQYDWPLKIGHAEQQFFDALSWRALS